MPKNSHISAVSQSDPCLSQANTSISQQKLGFYNMHITRKKIDLNTITLLAKIAELG